MIIITDSADLMKAYFEYGPPKKYAYVDFLPEDVVIRILTSRFKIEFAVVYTAGKSGYHIYTGRSSSVDIPLSKVDILLKHSHPMGTPQPSKADHDWLVLAKSLGSPQEKSIILPHRSERIAFRINTPYLT